MINGVPHNITTLCHGARRWQPIVDKLFYRVNKTQQEIVIHQKYKEYLGQVKDMIVHVAPRFIDKKRYGTHTGRRTGATLHIDEGMAIAVVMRLGGWTDIAEFEKYVRKAQTLTQLQNAK